MPNLRGVGREAEDRAADYLVQQGYTVVTRRYKTAQSELDIVALDGDVFVFVEVKFRRGTGFSAEESLSESKRQSLRRAIALYLRAMDIHPPRIRLDLIAIDKDGLRHHKDLFAP